MGRTVINKSILVLVQLGLLACSDNVSLVGSSQLAKDRPESSPAPASGAAPASANSLAVSPTTVSAVGAANPAASPAAQGADPSPPADAPSTPSTPIAGTTPSAPAPESPPAAVPQPVTGAYLLDCGVAGEPGYGCVVADTSTKAKTRDMITSPTFTVSLSNGQTLTPAVTSAATTDLWSFYLALPPNQLPLITTVSFNGMINGVATPLQTTNVLFNPQFPNPTTATTVGAGTAVLFTTNQVFVPGALFSGATGADALCGALANAPSSKLNGLKLTWHAFLSGDSSAGDSSDPATRIVGLATWGVPVNSMGQLITSAANATTWWLGEVGLQGFYSDEFGMGVYTSGADNVWTGSLLTANANGSGTGVAGGAGTSPAVTNVLEYTSNCNNWTASTVAGQTLMGEVGVTISTGTSTPTYTTWLSDATMSCATANHLYCIGH